MEAREAAPRDFQLVVCIARFYDPLTHLGVSAGTIWPDTDPVVWRNPERFRPAAPADHPPGLEAASRG